MPARKRDLIEEQVLEAIRELEGNDRQSTGPDPVNAGALPLFPNADPDDRGNDIGPLEALPVGGNVDAPPLRNRHRSWRHLSGKLRRHLLTQNLSLVGMAILALPLAAASLGVFNRPDLQLPPADTAPRTEGAQLFKMIETRFPEDRPLLVAMPEEDWNPGPTATVVHNSKLRVTSNTLVAVNRPFKPDGSTPYLLKVGLSAPANQKSGIHIKAGFAAFSASGNLLKVTEEFHRASIATGRLDAGQFREDETLFLQAVTFGFGNERSTQFPPEADTVMPVIYFWFEEPELAANLESVSVHRIGG